MAKAFYSDIWRCIKKGRKRFLAIAVITLLGVTMLTGLKAGCDDLGESADDFFDNQGLFDVSVVSTLGITEREVAKLSAIEGVDAVEGAFEERTYTQVGGVRKSTTVRALGNQGFNEPLLVQGQLPAEEGQVAVTALYLEEAGASLGDSLRLEPADEDQEIFARSEYTITGVVVDPTDINGSHAMVFRSGNSTDYSFFVTRESVTADVFTAAYVRIAGTSDLMCYSEDYEQLVAQVEERIESIRESAEQERTDEVVGEAQAELDDAKAEAEAEFAEAEAKFADAQAQIDNGYAQLAAAEAMGPMASGQVAALRAQLESGQAELDKQYAEYLTEKSDALDEIADAQKKIDSIEDAQWYIRNRASVGSYASIDSDTSSIETIGVSFSIIFLIVAILISLTTITRMVEEERGLIGTYKALGYRGKEIMAKYLLYAAGACAFGAAAGLLCGYVLLPKFLFVIFQYMYILPTLHLVFDPLYAGVSVAIFFVGIVGSAFLACRTELAQTPAALMRPKAPRGGSRIVLERIPFVWNRLSFLNKVTMRNLFRYKKRFFMTVAGIAGCTALLVCGFVIKDSVDALQPAQYGHVYGYDIMYVTGEDDLEDVTAWAQDRQETSELLEMRVDSVTVSRDGAEEDMQLMVIPEGESFKGYIALENEGGVSVDMDECGMAITKNASVILGFQEGEDVLVQTSELSEANVSVGVIAQNYLGNFMVMTQDAYEEAFGAYKANAAFMNVKAGADPIALNEELSQRGDVLSTVCIADLSATFESAFYLITAVTILLIGMAAALAFVVLFTLSTTNISERLRELATIKVLGFRRGEVHRYVNKETFILTLIGMIIGLPLGRWLGGLLTVVLEMPGVYFAVSLEPTSYLICAGFTLLFTLLVNLATNRTLDRVNMVEALKSVE